MTTPLRPVTRLSSATELALRPLSVVYGLVSQALIARHASRAFRSELPVISVGNLSIGGTGKTPLVIHLVQLLQQDRPVVVLSRGYGRRTSTPIIWRPEGRPPDPDVVGDEPALIARVLRHGAIGIGADRTEILRRLEHQFDDAVVVLDDGFQHTRLARDLDIVIIDDRTVDQARPLPGGVLREPARGLRRADLVVATSGRAGEWAATHTEAVVLSMRTRPVSIRRWNDGVEIDLDDVVLVTGIAAPERVARSARELGIAVSRTLRFGDHHRYSAADTRRMLDTARRMGSGVLLTTGKDAVKLERFPELADWICVIDTEIELSPRAPLEKLLRERLQRTRETT